jgi:hypothetical protein
LTFFQFFSAGKILHFSGSPAGGGGEVLGVVKKRPGFWLGALGWVT